MIEIECEQGSAEWLALRIGKATASRIPDVLAKTKSGPAASRENYIWELAIERLTGNSAESSFTNAAMQWGTEHEAEAALLYAFHVEEPVSKCGFINHATILMAGASPDRLVGDDGQAEIKCPNSRTHGETLDGGAIPGKYLIQMHWQMACTGRAWCDFVSYDPRFPAHMRMFVKRVKRDSGEIDRLEREVMQFLREVELKVENLRSKQGIKVQLEASLKEVA
jgi:putative phage-type endonuclease